MSEKVTVTDLIEFICEVNDLGHCPPTVSQWKYIFHMANTLGRQRIEKEIAEKEAEFAANAECMGEALAEYLFGQPEEEPEESFSLDAADLDSLWNSSVFALLSGELEEEAQEEELEEDLDVRFVLAYAREDDQTPLHVWTCEGSGEVDELMGSIQKLYGRIIVADDYREGRKPDPIVYSFHREQHSSYPPLGMTFELLSAQTKRPDNLGGIHRNPWEDLKSPYTHRWAGDQFTLGDLDGEPLKVTFSDHTVLKDNGILAIVVS